MRQPNGRFTPGERPSQATEIKPGERLSVATEFQPGERRSKPTEFQPGCKARNKLPLGSEQVRIETHTGTSRAWVKVAEPNIWKKRAVAVWEAVHGPLPAGSVVHHKDRNALNDSPDNLVGLTRGEHTNEHRKELVAAMARQFLGLDVTV